LRVVAIVAKAHGHVVFKVNAFHMLQEAMHRSRKGFKETLNAAIRAGLSQKPAAAMSRPYVIQARPLGLRAGLDPAGFNQLADDLELEAVLAKARNKKTR
jgi:hypothetical protein